MLLTYKYRMYPSKNQERLLGQTLETCRRWYNVCLAERKEAWEGEQRSVGKFEQLAKVKTYRQENPFAGQVHSHILQVVASDLDKAFQAFFRRVKAGEKAGYPRFRGRDRFDSFGFKEHRNGFRVDGRRLKLSGIGRVAVRWHRPIEGQIKTVRIRRQAGKWYACFACEVEAQPLETTGNTIGIDVGIASLLTTSDGEHIENPKWYRAEQAKLRVAQRRVSRRKKGGASRRKAVRILQAQHEHIANRRADYIKKLVHGLVTRYDCIAIEDLQVVNMAHNPHLSKSILDAGWGYFRQQLSSKAAYAGRTIAAVPPAYTSKTCSQCGTIFETLTLADRWVRCECGLLMDRDENAALNLLRLGRRRWEVT
jgi:putative transposase